MNLKKHNQAQINHIEALKQHELDALLGLVKGLDPNDPDVKAAIEERVSEVLLSNRGSKALRDQIADGTLKYHHTASRRGYIDRGEVEPGIEAYQGRFGRGAIVSSARFDTTQFIDIVYYIES